MAANQTFTEEKSTRNSPTFQVHSVYPHPPKSYKFPGRRASVSLRIYRAPRGRRFSIRAAYSRGNFGYA